MRILITYSRENNPETRLCREYACSKPVARDDIQAHIFHRDAQCLICDLIDFGYSLDENLRRLHNAECTAIFSPGEVVLDVMGADEKIVAPYVDAFYRAMSQRFGKRVFISYAA